MAKYIDKRKHYFIIILLITFCLVANVVMSADIEGLEQYSLFIDNDFLELYIKEESTEVAIRDKESEQIWYTNPPKREEIEQVANKFNKEALNAQLGIRFLTSGGKITDWNNYHESISYNQFSFEEIDDGIRFEYIFGKEWETEDYIPSMVSKSFFEDDILVKLDVSDKEFVKGNYNLVYLEKKDSADDYTYTDVSARIDEKDLFREYVLKLDLGDGQIVDLTAYGSEGRFSNTIKERMLRYILDLLVEGLDYMFITDLTHEDISVLNEPVYILEQNLFKWDLTSMGELFQEVELSPYDIALEHEKFNIEPPYANLRRFKIPLEYILDEKDLVVRIPLEDIEYPVDVMDYINNYEVTLPLLSVDVLPYFGAGSIEDEGYLFVPDGSGALIDFNNGKTDMQDYNKPVYGSNLSQSDRDNRMNISENIRMPVFGSKDNNKAYLAIIEEGDTMASIRAKVANDKNSYNTTYARFETIPYTNTQLQGGGASVNITQSRKNQGNIQIRYMLLSDKTANYSSMARAYQDYLREKHSWETLPAMDDLPLLIEIIGSYDKIMPRFGIPRRMVLPLTTFEESEKLIKELKLAGIENLDILYNGWLKGGIRHTYPDKLRIENEVGGTKDFKNLLKFLESEGISFYPEVSFLSVYDSSLFDDFSPLSSTANYLEGGRVKRYEYNVATFRTQEDRSSYLLSPDKLNALVDDFMKEFKKYDLESIAFRYLGNEYYSDFSKNPDELIDSQQSLNLILDELEKVRSQNLSYMIRGGNMPSVQNSEYIVETSLYAGSENLIDRGVPFYQMVLNGYKKYAGKPLNLSARPEVEMLKIVETGAVPFFRFSYREPEGLKISNYNENYSIYFGDWKEETVAMYHSLNKDIGFLQGKKILEHRQILENAYETLYEGNISVVVNYNPYSIIVRDSVIESNDYKVFEGGIK